MTDIRARLADALQPHAYENGRCHCGQRWTGNFDDHLADVLLSLDGIAIVDMTDPDSVNDVILTASRRLAAANKTEEK